RGKRGGGVLAVGLGDSGVDELARPRSVAVDREREPAAAAGALGVVVKLPSVPRAVVAQRGGAELAGDGGRDKRPAVLVLSGDEPDHQPRPLALAVEVHAQRADRTAAPARLLGPEEAEEDAAAAGGLRESERPRRAEPVVERLGADLLGVVRRLRRPRDPAAEFALRLCGEAGRTEAEVLHDSRDLLGHDAVVEPLPAGVL